MQLIIDTANTSLTVKSKLFFIENQKHNRHISPKRVSSIAITVNCNINTSAIKLAAQNQIPIYFFNHFGTIQARTWSPYFSNLASIRKKQITFYDLPEATQWVISLIERKSKYQIQTLKRLSKNKTSIQVEIKKSIEQIQEHSQKLIQFRSIHMDQCRNSIMGIEGNCSKIYYKSISMLLPEEFRFENRSRKPANDHFNAALNYLYGMTYSVVESGVFAKGFDPFTGYLHTENYKKTALVFDLIEPIRPLIDRILINLCINKQLKQKHFIPKEQGFWLSKAGKRVIIPTFNEYLHQRIKIDEKVMRLKDFIYNESNMLWHLIDTILSKSKK